MNAATVRLFIGRRFIPQDEDGSRHVIAAGRYPQQCPADLKADEALLSDLADALRDQQGGEPCT